MSRKKTSPALKAASSSVVGGRLAPSANDSVRAAPPAQLVRHIQLDLPSSWTNDQRGDFFEGFVADVLRPMRFAVERRLRVTGMEIDLLANGLDEPKKVLVECKAQRDALPAETISKLLGNVALRRADAGWLFSTSELSKDGRGQWEELRTDEKLAKQFVWYPPHKLIQILIDQGHVVDPTNLAQHFGSLSAGDATLVCSHLGKRWLFEVLESGLPAYLAVFDAVSGAPLSETDAADAARVSERFTSLKYLDVRRPSATLPRSPIRAPVARVVAGDTWEDLRPARPIDFVGRDDVIQDILAFIAQVRDGTTTTRTFAVQGPSGWGKSSLVLKLAELATRKRSLANGSLTAVDSRSATSSSFVISALRTALLDAQEAGLISGNDRCEVSSLTHPLDSPDVVSALQEIADRGAVLVLVLDQFEELFTKESLFETFNAIRELSLDLDSRQLPLVLGFAWKTDVSLPQQHPAYHLWHELADRRRDFTIRQFGSVDIAKVIFRAEREVDTKLTQALRTRLIEQCQGYPWLLKKLIVHVSRRLQTAGSQYALLERELDVEVLFKDDLAGLKPEQLRCLKYVAERAPAYVSDVEEHFTPEATNSLLSKRLLVRSGLNYVIYWDIFRDYLTDGRVPHIPWARTFQRDAPSAVRALQIVQTEGKVSAGRVAQLMSASERSSLNLMSDLVALQLVDRVAEDSYRLASHVKSTDPKGVAEHVYGQFARHSACRALSTFARGTPVPVEALDRIVKSMRAASPHISDSVIHQYAMILKRWLIFAGHLEERGSALYRPSAKGAQMGQLVPHRLKSRRQFFGAATPDATMQMLHRVVHRGRGIEEEGLLRAGYRNALQDALALGLVLRDEKRRVVATDLVTARSQDALILLVKKVILAQDTIKTVAGFLGTDSSMHNSDLGLKFKEALSATWKPNSAMRYANGLRRYLEWAKSPA